MLADCFKIVLAVRTNIAPAQLGHPHLHPVQGDGAPYANGSAHSSKRAQRLRSVYKHMRQTSLLDGDRIALVGGGWRG